MIYKLTDENKCARDGYHAYASPEIAVLMNPDHADFDSSRLFEAEGSGECMSGPLELRYQNLTLLKEIPLPAFTFNQRIWFGIQCALKVCDDPVFISWAKNWINGTDRSKESAKAISEKFLSAARANAAYVNNVAYNATAACVAAACAINTAAYYAAYATNTHACYAVCAVHFAACADPNIDFIDLAKQALAWQE